MCSDTSDTTGCSSAPLYPAKCSKGGDLLAAASTDIKRKTSPTQSSTTFDSGVDKPNVPFPYIPPAFSRIPDQYLIGLLEAYRLAANMQCTSTEYANQGYHTCKIRLKGGMECLPCIDPSSRPLGPADMRELQGFEERAASLPKCDEYGNLLKVCSICNTRVSSTWRRHGISLNSVCNCCGLYFKLNKRDRRIIVKDDGMFFVDRSQKGSGKVAAKPARKKARQSSHPYRRPEPKAGASDNVISGTAGTMGKAVQETTDAPHVDQRQLHALQADLLNQQFPVPNPMVAVPQQTEPLYFHMTPPIVFPVDEATALTALHQLIAMGLIVFDFSQMQFVLKPLPTLSILNSLPYTPPMDTPSLANTPFHMATPIQQFPSSVQSSNCMGDSSSPFFFNSMGSFL